MQPSDRAEFVRVLNGLAMLKPGSNKLTPEALDVWWAAMRGWSLTEFREAAAHLAKSVEFMPNPFHFEQIRKQAGEQTAAEAWVLVLQNLRRSEYRRGVTVGGRADLVVKGMGGYEGLGKRNPEKLNEFGAREFRERWDEVSDREEVRAALPSLAPPEARPALRNASGPQPVGALLDRLVKPR